MTNFPVIRCWQIGEIYVVWQNDAQSFKMAYAKVKIGYPEGKESCVLRRISSILAWERSVGCGFYYIVLIFNTPMFPPVSFVFYRTLGLGQNGISCHCFLECHKSAGFSFTLDFDLLSIHSINLSFYFS